jgi:hypothetical protein
MGVTLMRILTIAIAAAVLALPAAAPAQACGGAGLHSAKVATADYSAATKKKKPPQKKEKVEYMRAAPMK